MAKATIRVLEIKPPYPTVSDPNKTLFIDATAADSLGMSEIHITGEIKNLTFTTATKNKIMTAVLHSLEFPSGNILRMTKYNLNYFGLKAGRLYWMEWDKAKKTLKVLRQVSGK